MRIAMCCQNGREVSAHPGKCTRFILVDTDSGLAQWLTLPADAMLRQAALTDHALTAVGAKPVPVEANTRRPPARRRKATTTIMPSSSARVAKSIAFTASSNRPRGSTCSGACRCPTGAETAPCRPRPPAGPERLPGRR